MASSIFCPWNGIVSFFWMLCPTVNISVLSCLKLITAKYDHKYDTKYDALSWRLAYDKGQVDSKTKITETSATKINKQEQ